ncbi:MAG: FixH family protein [Thiotrichaceae bacterium]|jgi:hypothetical protein|uniref:FixH family protein n=1 Tax=Candidatus Thiocaldithrix dubininis TaxID=3080823 RepID=A0AA95H6H0_9GAMM|nr:MAG: FixH family protein [Candidatus Thiocaldithrix dubininis]
MSVSIPYVLLSAVLGLSTSVSYASTPWQLSQTSVKGQLQSELQCVTAPAVGDFQNCTLKLNSTQTLPSDLTIAMDGGMPAHGHGLPTAPKVVATDKVGEYRIEGLKYSMTGEWLLGFMLQSKSMNDKIVYKFSF